MYEKIRYPQNAEAAWEATKPLLTENSVYSGDFISRFAMSSSTKPLTLFVPWGVRPTDKFMNNEKMALDTVQNYQNLLKKYEVPSNVLIMPADVYATEVNNYDPTTTNDYFSIVRNESKARGFQVKPWSQIRKDNQALYDRVLIYEANIDSLWRSTPKKLWYDGLLKAAYRRSGKESSQEIARAAFDYLKERVAEARVIESIYKPIKLSMVEPNKDDVVDRDLPRLYLLPSAIRFPWISKTGDRYAR